ncbi:hypothetical protein HanHA300_Chr08g0278091 [Helianthus annuus]|nr:hypothetical protein HanHA300_Chr08g0278091 [Helianthus annuus]KAJ0901427.1 hypothetical protein HanPSC8_Chr08g0325191 [Helianthus annuus]
MILRRVTPREQQYGGGDLEMGTQHNANSGELGLDEFFKKDAHEESKGVTKAAAMKRKLQFFYFGSVFIIFISLLSAGRRSTLYTYALKRISQHMEKDVDKVGKVARFIKSKIEELDKEALRESIHQEHREVVERRVYTGFELNLNIKIVVGNLRFPNHIYYIA